MNLWQRYPAREIWHAPTVVGKLLIWQDFYSPQLDNRRDVLVYLPPSYEHSDRRYPVLYMHDGQNLFDSGTSFAGSEWQVDETMEALAGEGIEAIVVGLNNTGEQRTAEYNPFPHFWQGHGEVYLQFIIETVKPLIDQDFRTRPDRDSTGIMGSSMGGLISLYAFFRASATFGFAGVMSPSLWVGGGAMYGVVESSPFIAGKLYVDNGTREPSARRLNALLLKQGYRRDVDVKYVVEPDGEHNEAAWARRLPDALRFLLPR
ncbi:MAG TPA: alpha/beta hydrolase-fold protein [Phototrophicaceae bacterium]|nr:alpha/beta hydrolase-fold protein [Phototrophicaceae bacterium]